MSGIEVAGLVLGAFPLLISALEHYRDVAETLEIFWKIKREYKLWVHDLKICELAFETNLEALLLPLVAEDDEVQELLKDPRGLRWQDPELETRLKARLPKSYILYVECINRVQDIMDEIKEELGVNQPEFQKKLSDEARAWTDASLDAVKANMGFYVRRIKMSFAKSKRENLFKQLTMANNELRDLLDTSDKIAALRQRRSTVRRSEETKGLWQFWRHADKLYKLLAQSWLCECRKFHLANLLLQHRTSPAPDFHVCFLFGNPENPISPSWIYQEARIRILEKPEPVGEAIKRPAVGFVPDPIEIPSPQPAPAPKVPVPLESSHPPRTPSPSLKTKSKDKWKAFSKESFFRNWRTGKRENGAVPSSNEHSDPSQPAPLTENGCVAAPQPPRFVVTEAQGNSGTEEAKDIEGMISVTSLCAEMPKLLSHTEKEPFFIQGNHCSAALHPICLPKSQRASVKPSDTVTLEALLSKNTPRALTRRERYLIALTLAASYLQLKSSAWIRPGWSKRDIHFLGSKVDSSGIRTEYPYIVQSFEGIDNLKRPDKDDGYGGEAIAQGGQFDRGDRTLASLGIMLLELCFGVALEDHETRKKYSHQTSQGNTSEAAANPFFDMAAALEWSPDVVEEAGPEFAEAVGWCLKNMPGSGKADGTLDGWREELFEKVVLPLKYCNDQFAAVRA